MCQNDGTTGPDLSVISTPPADNCMVYFIFSLPADWVGGSDGHTQIDIERCGSRPGVLSGSIRSRQPATTPETGPESTACRPATPRHPHPSCRHWFEVFCSLRSMSLTVRHASTQSLQRCAQSIRRGRNERQEALDDENRSNTRRPVRT